ncbi:MAG: sulfatase-like hydrolase/transferase, partial [Holophagales bacterium]|nr:sulfatase-like hydrolase/transferase [Holophagales bacterium]
MDRLDHLDKGSLQSHFLRLAREGVVFERAYSVAPITLPAHTSILTGMYPFSHGVRNNGIQYVPEEAVTLAEILRERGYRTGAFVSAAVLERQYGLDQGFEVYDDDLSTGRDRRPRMVADRPAEAVFDSARAWLDTLGDDEPYFLWIHLYDPHAAYSPPAPYRDRYRDRLYDGEIAYMDAQIGEFLDHPKIAAEGSRAPILTVLGDHGESLGQHGERTHAILAYDSTLHVPWLLRIPGALQGVRIPDNVSHVDLLPTLLQLIGQDPPPDLHGTSLVPLLAGLDGASRGLYAETYLPFYTYGWAKLRVLRSRYWKYIDAPTPELYRLDQDPRELTNLFDQQPGAAHDLARDLEALLGTVEDPEQEASLALDPESAEKLRSLGYLAAGSGPAVTGERLDPKDVVDLHVSLERVRYLLQDRFFEQAELELRKLLDRDPQNIAGLIELIASLEGQQRYDDALRAAERVLELDPNYTRIYVILARIEAARGELDKAVELTALAASKDSRNTEAAVSHAAMLQQAGRPAEAREALEGALELAPEHPRLNTVYARLVELPAGRLDAAEERLRRVLERDPFLASAYSGLGRVLALRRRHAEAEETYRQGLQ